MLRLWTLRLTIGLLSLSTCGACTTLAPSPPPRGDWVACKVDPALREPLARPADPVSDKPRVLEAYSLRQAALLDKSEGRTAAAVQAVDDCNDVNTKLAQALAPKKAWWHVW